MKLDVATVLVALVSRNRGRFVSRVSGLRSPDYSPKTMDLYGEQQYRVFLRLLERSALAPSRYMCVEKFREYRGSLEHQLVSSSKYWLQLTSSFPTEKRLTRLSYLIIIEL